METTAPQKKTLIKTKHSSPRAFSTPLCSLATREEINPISFRIDACQPNTGMIEPI
jgi:hypothetical protein